MPSGAAARRLVTATLPFSGAVIDRGRIVLAGDPGLGACPRPDSENTWEK
jgi:hypothetical protein